MRYKCRKTYESKKGKTYFQGDVIYWSEYYSLPTGEDLYWLADEDELEIYY